MKEILLKGGLVSLAEGLQTRDIRIVGESIAQTGDSLTPLSSSCEEVDCQGLFVLPGFIDMHIHVDDNIGPFSLADSWQTASAAAIGTGITTLVSFATERPGHTITASVDEMVGKASGQSHCDFQLHLTPIQWKEQTWRELSHLSARGFSTIKLYTTYRQSGLYSTYRDIHDIMQRAKCHGYTVLLHCEDEEVLNETKRGSPFTAQGAILHSLERTAESELRAIEQAISLCRETSCPLHIVHVSTAEGARIIGENSDRMPITYETCLQYLLLDSGKLEIEGGHRYLCTPPLRDETERRSLLQIARSGKTDVLATDHCAFAKDVKDSALENIVQNTPKGLPGVGSLVPLARESFIQNPARDLHLLTAMLSTHPAQICGLYPQKGSLQVGADADIAVVDLFATPTLVRSSLANVHEPYPNTFSRYRAKRVYLRGTLVARDGTVLQENQPRGTLAWQKEV